MTNSIGILGARSFVGDSLLNISTNKNLFFSAFSRRKMVIKSDNYNVDWQLLMKQNPEQRIIKHWICLAPIWVLPDYFTMLQSYGIQRIVVLSSTSRFTKTTSSNAKEKVVVKQLIDGETQFCEWAERQQIEWIILRPTLIYGLGKDKNISTIIKFIKRFSFFPLFGLAKGKRQPIHVEDVAKACIRALNTEDIANQAYNITGKETLEYDVMVKRIFNALDKKCCLFYFPLSLFRIASEVLGVFPGFKNVNSAMAERMSQDLVFDSSDAIKDFKFSSRNFRLGKEDIL